MSLTDICGAPRGAKKFKVIYGFNRFVFTCFADRLGSLVSIYGIRPPFFVSEQLKGMFVNEKSCNYYG